MDKENRTVTEEEVLDGEEFDIERDMSDEERMIRTGMCERLNAELKQAIRRRRGKKLSFRTHQLEIDSIYIKFMREIQLTNIKFGVPLNGGGRDWIAFWKEHDNLPDDFVEKAIKEGEDEYRKLVENRDQDHLEDQG